MKNKIFITITTIFFLIIFFIFYKGLQNSSIYVPKKNFYENIPSFTVKRFGTEDEINSKEIFLSDKFYLMNIWASWCLPCMDEHSFLMNLSNQNNIEIIGLNYKDKNKNAKRFLEKLSNPYKIILSDQDGTISIEWGAYGVPESFLIHNKKIIKKITGPINKDILLEIKKLIK